MYWLPQCGIQIRFENIDLVFRQIHPKNVLEIFAVEISWNVISTTARDPNPIDTRQPTACFSCGSARFSRNLY